MWRINFWSLLCCFVAKQNCETDQGKSEGLQGQSQRLGCMYYGYVFTVFIFYQVNLQNIFLILFLFSFHVHFTPSMCFLGYPIRIYSIYGYISIYSAQCLCFKRLQWLSSLHGYTVLTWDQQVKGSTLTLYAVEYGCEQIADTHACLCREVVLRKIGQRCSRGGNRRSGTRLCVIFT